MNQQELLPVLKPTLKPRRLIVGYGSNTTPGVDVPCLRLRGRWLQDAGFVIGRHVRIELAEGRMTIEPAWLQPRRATFWRGEVVAQRQKIEERCPETSTFG
jgi:hypothetical protein